MSSPTVGGAGKTSWLKMVFTGRKTTQVTTPALHALCAASRGELALLTLAEHSGSGHAHHLHREAFKLKIN